MNTFHVYAVIYKSNKHHEATDWLQWLQREILEFLNLGPIFSCFTVKLLILTKMHLESVQSGVMAAV